MNRLLKRMIEGRTEIDTGSEDDIGIYLGPIRCYQMEAIFWRFRGRRLPGRGAKAARRYDRKYKQRYIDLIDQLSQSVESLGENRHV